MAGQTINLKHTADFLTDRFIRFFGFHLAKTAAGKMAEIHLHKFPRGNTQLLRGKCAFPLTSGHGHLSSGLDIRQNPWLPGAACINACVMTVEMPTGGNLLIVVALAACLFCRKRFRIRCRYLFSAFVKQSDPVNWSAAIAVTTLTEQFGKSYSWPPRLASRPGFSRNG